MMDKGGLFQDEEVLAAERKLRVLGRHSLASAFRFQASLKALVMDASRNQRAGEIRTVFAVDPVEVVKSIDYGIRDFQSFVFSGFLDRPQDPRWRQSLRDLDSLISSRLFSQTEKASWASRPFLLPDSYFSELLDVRARFEKSNQKQEDVVFGDQRMTDLKFSGFKRENLENIRDYILSQKESTKIKGELKDFTERFMSHWRIDFVDTVIESRKRLDSLDEFLKKSDYVHIRNEHYGRRALERILPGFDWAAFDGFLASEKINAEFADIKRVVSDLAAGVSKYGMSAAAIGKAALNDGLALADIHVLNSFLESTHDERRVELVSRSSLLPDILRSLPSGRVKVQIRHPLLLPEVFGFDDGAISNISRIARRFDDVMTPYLEHFERSIETGEDAATSSELISLAEGRAQSPEASLALTRAREIGQEFVRWLLDSSLVQASKSTPDEVFGSAYARTIAKEGDRSRPQVDPEIIRLLKELFETIINNLDGRGNPLTYGAIRELVRKNQLLANTVWERAYGVDSKITARVIRIDEGSVCSPIPCVALRVVGGRHTRIVHLHSRRVQEKLLSSVASLQRLSTESITASATIPFPVNLENRQTIEQFSDLMEKLASDPNGTAGDDLRVYMIDVTLIVSVALASKGESSTAISLASTVLHHFMSQLRQDGLTATKQMMSKKLCLAYQELFLFRHFCERQIAISELVAQKSGATVSFVRGSVERNFARAQRDLDIAADLVVSSGSDDATRIVGEIRLRLIHMSGWIDMFIITAGLDLLSNHSTAERPLIKLMVRRDIWVGLGMVKECLDDEEQVRRMRLRPETDIETTRYLAHIEARLLQNSLTVFFALLFSESVPMLDRFLDPCVKIQPEHVFKFADWKSWWSRFASLIEDFKFRFRFFETMGPVADMLIAIDHIRSDVSDDGNKLRYSAEQKAVEGRGVLMATLAELEKFNNEVGGFSTIFRDHVKGSLRNRLSRSESFEARRTIS